MAKGYKTETGTRLRGFHKEGLKELQFTDEEKLTLANMSFGELMQDYQNLAQYEHGEDILMPDEGSPIYDMSVLDYVNYLIENKELVAYETDYTLSTPVGPIIGEALAFNPYQDKLGGKPFARGSDWAIEAGLVEADLKGPDTLLVARDIHPYVAKDYVDLLGRTPTLVEIFIHELGHLHELTTGGSLEHNVPSQFDKSLSRMTSQDWEDLEVWNEQNLQKWHEETRLGE